MTSKNMERNSIIQYNTKINHTLILSGVGEGARTQLQGKPGFINNKKIKQNTNKNYPEGGDSTTSDVTSDNDTPKLVSNSNGPFNEPLLRSLSHYVTSHVKSTSQANTLVHSCSEPSATL